jgi:hypothetical protein
VKDLLEEYCGDQVAEVHFELDDERFQFEQVDKDNRGDGTAITAVIAVSYPGGEFFFKLTGTYFSYSDSEWYTDSVELVAPQQVVVTQYLPV